MIKFCLALLIIIPCLDSAQVNSIPVIGVVENIENDSILNAFGYKLLVENTAKFLSPRTVSDTEFEQKLSLIRRSRISFYGCNIFIPGDLKVVGPSVDEKAVLTYIETVLQRGQKAGIELITWGSGGSRRIPDGFDRKKAKQQFIAIAKKAAALAEKYDIVLAVENLNTTEVNFINTASEALEIVKAVNHKNLRLCVDIYHMLKENESPDVILKAKNYVVYCELAEKEDRTPPGVHGDDFRPYLAALRKINFKGKIVIECRWADVKTQGQRAYDEVQKQLTEVYGKN